MKKMLLFLTAIFSGIAAFSQENAVRLPAVPNKHDYVQYSEKNNGFWCSAGVTAGYSITSGKGACEVSADFIGGYRFNEYVRLGMGVSPRFLVASHRDFPKSGQSVECPLYFDVRGNFLPQDQRMFSPYWSFDAGYTFNCGAYASPTLGLKFGGLRNDFLIGLSYVMQQYVYKEDCMGIRNMICLKLAYEF